MKLKNLFDLIEKENIIVEYVDFSSTIQGIYYKADGCLPIIGINENIVSNKKLFACVLAEELGHHFTSVGDSPAECYSLADKMNLSRTELTALKWAAEYLLPLDEIVDAIKKGIENIEELSDFLGVTGEFLLERFKFIAKKQPYIKIQKNLFITLTNLPNIYLYEGYQETQWGNSLCVENNIRESSLLYPKESPLLHQENNNILVAEECKKGYNI